MVMGNVWSAFLLPRPGGGSTDSRGKESAEAEDMDTLTHRRDVLHITE